MVKSTVVTVIFVGIVLVASSVVAGEPTVYESAEKTQPLKAGEKAPDITVRSVEGDEVTLASIVTKQPTVLIFYRGGWCPYCTRHLKGLRNVEDDLAELGYQLIAVSPDSPENLAAASEKHRLGYELYSDADTSAAQAFGVAFRLDDETLSKYDGYGIDLGASSGGSNKDVLPVPSVFLITTDGKIVWTHSDPDYTKRLDNDALLSAAKEHAGAASAEGSSKKEGS